MPRKVGHVIHDILEAIERVEEITRGKTLPDFEKRLHFGSILALRSRIGDAPLAAEQEP
jgi:uncharacterized protein with HEPN domain